MAFPSYPSAAKLPELIHTMISFDRLPVALRARSVSQTKDVLGRMAAEVPCHRNAHFTWPSLWRLEIFLRNGGTTQMLPMDISPPPTRSPDHYSCARLFSVSLILTHGLSLSRQFCETRLCFFH